MNRRGVRMRRRDRGSQGARVLVSLFGAMLFDLVSFGADVDALRPDLSLLVLLYWSTRTPSPANVAAGWIMGLLHDVAGLTPLGLSAGLYCLTAWIGMTARKRLESLPVSGELLVILLILLTGSMLAWGVGSLTGGHPLAQSHLVAPMIGTLCWPLVRMALDAVDAGQESGSSDD